MNIKLVKNAIRYPRKYPWSKEYILIEGEELDRELIECNLDTEEKRVLAGLKISFNIYKNIKLNNSYKEAIIKTLDSLSDEKYVSRGVIESNLHGAKLQKNEGKFYLLYNFMNGEVKQSDIKSNSKLFINWLVDISTFYKIEKLKNNIDEFESDITDSINNLIDNGINYSNEVKRSINFKGFNSLKVIDMIVEEFKGQEKEIEDLVEELIKGGIITDKNKVNKEIEDSSIKEKNIEEDKSCDISESILDIFNSSNKLNLTKEETKIYKREFNENIKGNGINEEKIQREVASEKKSNKDNKEETDKVNISKQEVAKEKVNKKQLDKEKINEDKSEKVEAKSNIVDKNKKEDTVYTDLKKLANTLGYKIAKEDEIILSKEKYKRLIDSKSNNGISILKELASLKNEAILSELYNSFKNINEVTKENMEATLSNFFFNLNVTGFEVIDDENKVGDIIEVDTKDVLKEFLFIEPVNKSGKLKVKVEYLGWRYKERQVIPMIVRVVE